MPLLCQYVYICLFGLSNLHTKEKRESATAAPTPENITGCIYMPNWVIISPVWAFIWLYMDIYIYFYNIAIQPHFTATAAAKKAGHYMPYFQSTKENIIYIYYTLFFTLKRASNEASPYIIIYRKFLKFLLSCSRKSIIKFLSFWNPPFFEIGRGKSQRITPQL